MKRSNIILLSVLAIVLLWGVSTYNGLISINQEVKKTWANVESAYQRRNDLVNQLIDVVKQASNYEKSTLEAVVNARASATQVKLDINDLTPEKMQQFQAAQQSLSGALGRLLAISENYPNLKAMEQYGKLQNSIEETENRIKKERDIFNETVARFNVKVKKLPTALIAGFMGYSEKPMFQAEAGTEKAPDVGSRFNN